MKKDLFVILLLVVSAFDYLILSKAVEFYVSPTEPDQIRDCNSHFPCYTLSEYATNASSLLSNKLNNISLIFLNGVYTLVNDSLEIENVTNLTISGNGKGSVPSLKLRSVIQVYSGLIKLHGIHDLRMENVKITTVSYSSAYIDLIYSDVRHISYENIHTEKCNVTINIVNNHQDQNNTNVSKSFMSSDYLSRFMTTASTVYINGSIFNSSSLEVKAEDSSHTQIFISQSQFLDSPSSAIWIKVGEGSALYLVILSCTIARSSNQGFNITYQRSSVIIQIKKCLITENYNVGLFVRSTKTNYANLELNIDNSTIKSNRHAALIYNCWTGKIRFNHCVLTNNLEYAIVFSTFIGTRYNSSYTVVIFVNNSVISRNSGGVQLNFRDVYFKNINFTLMNCLISHNRMKIVRFSSPEQLHTKYAAAISIWGDKRNFFGRFLLKNVSFIDNHNHLKETIMQLANTDNVTVEDCLFQGNSGTPIKAYSSNFVISGDTMFDSNIAIQGGALNLFFSRVFFSKNSNITFINNTAKSVGGAIYVERFPDVFSIIPRCFYGYTKLKMSTKAPMLYFNNNTAGYGGEDIYGASAHEQCDMSTTPNMFENGTSSMFHFNSNQSSLSSISSDPKRVCLCDETGYPQCENLSYVFSTDERYPGERFNISVVVVGMEYGTVTGSVYAQIFHRGLYPLGTKQHSQAADYRHCNELTYSVHSYQKKETLVLTANEATVEVFDYISELSTLSKLWQTVPVFINITLRDCPLGFILQGQPPSCQCHNSLTDLELGIDCDIINGTGVVYRSGRVWINAFFSGNESNGVVVHKDCPYDYCKEKVTSVDLRYPDAQCALNHSGILCGGCPPDLSLALGSNQCLPCSNNNHLAFLIFFIAAGFLLVIFIKVLDLTVAKGTINGLIFYANIVWAYQSILFPAQDNTNLALQFLRAYLAWLNLDFGIETCFITELNAYWKTWLQFVFPIYVWLIAGFIIVTSHYLTLAGKLFGNNSVPVLATLFLLSYAKLARTIITVLGFAFLHYPDHTSVVWTFDGNLPYFGLEHTFLFVAALAALLFLWLPFVSTLLLVPWLKRKSHLEPLRWINRWKPFYDAYYGPLKDKQHYWVGLLLFVRGALLVVFSVTSANINILAMILTPSVLLLYTSHIRNVYKNRFLSLLENSFFLNLIFLGSAIFYIETFKGSKATILQISVWFAFIQFVCIILFHICCSLKKTFGKRCTRKRPNSETNPDQRRINTNQRVRRPDQLRESLLESVVQP